MLCNLPRRSFLEELDERREAVHLLARSQRLDRRDGGLASVLDVASISNSGHFLNCDDELADLIFGPAEPGKQSADPERGLMAGGSCPPGAGRDRRPRDLLVCGVV